MVSLQTFVQQARKHYWLFLDGKWDWPFTWLTCSKELYMWGPLTFATCWNTNTFFPNYTPAFCPLYIFFLIAPIFNRFPRLCRLRISQATKTWLLDFCLPSFYSSSVCNFTLWKSVSIWVEFSMVIGNLFCRFPNLSLTCLLSPCPRTKSSCSLLLGNTRSSFLQFPIARYTFPLHPQQHWFHMSHYPNSVYVDSSIS